MAVERTATMPPPGGSPDGERVTWLGHASVLIETGGARLLTDPVLGRRVAHLRRHAPLTPDPGRLDAILISHLHHDHLDRASLRALDPTAPVIVPRGAGRTRIVRSLGREVHELDAGDSITVADVRIEAARAVHDGRRLPLADQMPALGFVIQGGQRVYFAGDTELFDGMRAIGAEPIDVALLPVWGWGPRLGPGHMDPDQAAQAAAMVRPALAVPIHWGTLLPLGSRRRLGRLLHTPGAEFAERVAARAPGVRRSSASRLPEPSGRSVPQWTGTASAGWSIAAASAAWPGSMCPGPSRGPQPHTGSSATSRPGPATVRMPSKSSVSPAK